MKLWEISKLMNTDRLFKVSDDASVDTETGVKDVAVTIRFSKGRESVEVKKDAYLPDRFRRYTWTPNKAEITKALKEGQEIAGCRLVRKPSVSVK